MDLDELIDDLSLRAEACKQQADDTDESLDRVRARLTEDIMKIQDDELRRDIKLMSYTSIEAMRVTAAWRAQMYVFRTIVGDLVEINKVLKGELL